MAINGNREAVPFSPSRNKYFILLLSTIYNKFMVIVWKAVDTRRIWNEEKILSLVSRLE